MEELHVFDNNLETTVTSASQAVTIGRNGPVRIIGERINPTGRKQLMAALQEGDLDVVREISNLVRVED